MKRNFLFTHSTYNTTSGNEIKGNVEVGVEGTIDSGALNQVRTLIRNTCRVRGIELVADITFTFIYELDK